MSGRIVGELYLPDVPGNYFLRDDGAWAAVPAGAQGPAQRTSLATFVTNVGVPGFNTEQGL